MSKQFNRLSKLVDELKDMDHAIMDAVNIPDAENAMTIANHHLMRHTAVNSAIIADLLDRLVTDLDSRKGDP